MSYTAIRRQAQLARSRFLIRCLSTALVLVSSLSLASSNAFAQETATGTIRGRILNASNGAYLANAKVSIAGTNREVLTNSFGEYELRNVPVGDVSINANYVGEPQQSSAIEVKKDDVATKDFTFRESPDARRAKDGSIVLDPLSVNASRYKNARDIAIAEERTSVNIKNVISVDQFGDIPSNNLGELVKFIPGVQISYGSYNGNNQGYSDSDASGVSIRGFGAEDTAITIDGMPVANAAPGGLTRQVGLDQLSINNASRVEVTKVATPDMPNNSIGGQINLVSRSAFELAKPSYAGRVFFNFNSQEPPKLKKTPGPVNKHTYKTTPGFKFSASVPLTPTLGISVTGSAANEFNSSHRAETSYGISGSASIVNAAGKPQTVDNPILNRFKVTDIARLTERRSGNIRLDWKPTSHQMLKANVQYSEYSAAEGQRRLDARPTIAAGADWNANQTIGTTANSTMDMTVTTRDVEGNTKSGSLQYSYIRGGWDISAGASYSDARTEFTDRDNGHFSEVSFKLNPGQVKLLDIKDGIPGTIETSKRLSNGGGPLDYTKFTNFTPDAVIAKSGEATSQKKTGVYKVDIERDLSTLGFIGSNTLSFKVGARRDQEKSEKYGIGSNYSEELVPGATFPIADVFDDTYLGIGPGYGYPAQEWGSTYKLFAINKANPIFGVPADGTTAVNNWNSYVGQQINLTETRDAFYAMLSGKFFRDRLYVVGGLRQESFSRKGRGPYRDPKWNYLKNSDLTLYKDAANPAGVRLDQATSPLFTPAGAALRSTLTAAKIPFPDHVLGDRTTSLESAMLYAVPNYAIDAKQTGKPSYSLNTVFKVTKKIDFKLAWSRSFGLPPLEGGIGGILSGSGAFQINENTTIPADGTIGSITVANPNLKPQTASNWDAEVSYYTDTGGKFSLSYYIKDVTDQIESYSTYSGTPGFDQILDALGLDPASYDNWILKTSSNSRSKQKTSGWELFASQDFGFLGSFGKRFSAFASFALKTLANPSDPVPVELTTPSGAVISTTPTVNTVTLSANKSGGAGLQYSGRRLSVQLRGVYRNDNETTGRTSLPSVNGVPNFYRRFEPAKTSIDLSANYTLSKTYSLFISGRDIFSGSRSIIARDDLGILPAYAQFSDRREFGAVWTFGVNGRW